MLFFCFRKFLLKTNLKQKDKLKTKSKEKKIKTKKEKKADKNLKTKRKKQKLTKKLKTKIEDVNINNNNGDKLRFHGSVRPASAAEKPDRKVIFSHIYPVYDSENQLQSLPDIADYFL